MALAQAVTTALFQRERSGHAGTGRGQLVESSLLHAGIWVMGVPLVLSMVGQAGAIDWIPTRRSYKSADGVWYQMLGSTPAQRHLPRLVEAMVEKPKRLRCLRLPRAKQ